MHWTRGAGRTGAAGQALRSGRRTLRGTLRSRLCSVLASHGKRWPCCSVHCASVSAVAPGGKALPPQGAAACHQPRLGAVSPHCSRRCPAPPRAAGAGGGRALGCSRGQSPRSLPCASPVGAPSSHPCGSVPGVVLPSAPCCHPEPPWPQVVPSPTCLGQGLSWAQGPSVPAVCPGGQPLNCLPSTSLGAHRRCGDRCPHGPHEREGRSVREGDIGQIRPRVGTRPGGTRPQQGVSQGRAGLRWWLLGISSGCFSPVSWFYFPFHINHVASEWVTVCVGPCFLGKASCGRD